MKPVKIKICGFSSYLNETEIDFEKLSSNGLFLIMGDTGAGKTTIFDAITFALYGQASGKNRKYTMLRSDLADKDDKTYVILEFIHKEKVYKIERHIKTIVPKKKEGPVRLEQRVLMYFPDGEIKEGQTEVNTAVEKLLQINTEQFRQIAMIAQGDFMKLIISADKDRSDILRDIFSTEIYEILQRQLKDRARKISAQYEKLQDAVKTDISEIIFRDEDEKFNINGEKYINEKIIEDILDKTDIILNEDKSLLKEKESVKDNLHKQNEEFALKIGYAGENNKSIEDFEKAEKVYIELNEQHDKYRQAETELKKIKNAVYFVKAEENKMLSKKSEYETIKDMTDNYRSEMNDALTRISYLDEAYKNEYAKLHDAEILKNEYITIENTLGKYDIYENSKNIKQNLELKLEKISSDINICNKNLQKTDRQILSANEKIKNLDNIQTIHEKCLSEIKDLKNRKTHIDLILNKIVQNKSARTKLEKLKNQYLTEYKKFEEKQAVYNKLKQQFWNCQAGFLSQELADGQPCPVCGSTSHPHKAEIPAEEISKKYVEDAEKEYRNSESIIKDLTARIDAGTEYISRTNDEICSGLEERLQKNIQKNEAEKTAADEIKNLTDAIIDAETRLKKCEKDIKEKEKLQKEYNILINSKEKAETDIKRLEDEYNKFHIECEKNSTVIQSLESELVFGSKKDACQIIDEKKKLELKILSGINDAKKRLDECQEIITSRSDMIQKNEPLIQTRHSDYITAMKIFADKIIEYGFSGENEYSEYLQSEKEINTLENDIANYNKNYSTAKYMYDKLRKETENRKFIDISVLKYEKTNIEQSIKLCETEIMNLKTRILQNERIYERITDKSKEIKNTEKKYSIVSRLSNIANGVVNNNRKKTSMALEQYVQMFYFDEIIAEANKRLSKMTGNQYALIRSDNKSFDLDVKDRNTGKNRSVKSLSGGEAFKASLCMALGLSDIIERSAGGVRLDMMFIDEGFGGLDSNSLEQAVSALTSLSYSSRCVGIISHVKELADRIDSKLIVEKTLSGSNIKIDVN